MTHLLAPTTVADILDIDHADVAATCARLGIRRYDIEGLARYQAVDVITAGFDG